MVGTRTLVLLVIVSLIPMSASAADQGANLGLVVRYQVSDGVMDSEWTDEFHVAGVKSIPTISGTQISALEVYHQTVRGGYAYDDIYYFDGSNQLVAQMVNSDSQMEQEYIINPLAAQRNTQAVAIQESSREIRYDSSMDCMLRAQIMGLSVESINQLAPCSLQGIQIQSIKWKQSGTGALGEAVGKNYNLQLSANFAAPWGLVALAAQGTYGGDALPAHWKMDASKSFPADLVLRLEGLYGGNDAISYGHILANAAPWGYQLRAPWGYDGDVFSSRLSAKEAWEAIELSDSAAGLTIRSGGVAVQSSYFHEIREGSQKDVWRFHISDGTTCNSADVSQITDTYLIRRVGPATVQNKGTCQSGAFLALEQLPTYIPSESSLVARGDSYDVKVRHVPTFSFKGGESYYALVDQRDLRDHVYFSATGAYSVYDRTEFSADGLLIRHVEGEGIVMPLADSLNPTNTEAAQLEFVPEWATNQPFWVQAAAGLSLLALLAVATRYALTLGLFARVAGPELLEHPVRRQILETVKSNPGIHLEELVRSCNLGRGQSEHHLRKLSDAGFLTMRSGPGFRCIFPVGSMSQESMDALPAIRSEGAFEVMRAISNHRTTTKQIATATDLQLSTVSYHLKRLAGAGLVMVERVGRECVVEMTGPGKRALNVRLRHR